ncbi:metallophosphoesterase family protein [Staphylospora marina]|uniref:metallophosphoesterase family protein n=1 Tax=Staphylospora marina TaxID=2490858 RepID=UPI000F5BFA50|nr:metallophosphoesterase [Staphylospora marina]
MRVLIVSDSHGREELLRQIVRREQADHVIHCGDFCTDRERLPDVPMTVVRGNCDWEPVPEEQLWEADGLRILVVHGHRHGVKRSPLPLRFRALEVGANVACFGHSHVPFCEKDGEVLLINPGSISLPRIVKEPTYAVLQWSDISLKVTYHTPDGTLVPGFGYEEKR